MLQLEPLLYNRLIQLLEKIFTDYPDSMVAVHTILQDRLDLLEWVEQSPTPATFSVQLVELLLKYGTRHAFQQLLDIVQGLLPDQASAAVKAEVEALLQFVDVENEGIGDYVAGDKIVGDTLTVGDVEQSVIAIGKHAQAIVNQYTQNIQQISPAEEAKKALLQDLHLLAESVYEYVRRLEKTFLGDSQNITKEPYRGLVAYEISDAAYFYGRDDAIRNLLRLVQSKRLTILQSESGAGKSSLLKAGISAHLLAHKHFPIVIRSYDVEPGLKVKQTLLPGLEQTKFLKQRSLRDFLYEVTKVLGAQTTLYLILDQFEEFFTALRDEEARQQFIADLQVCYDESILNVHWLLSIRSEYFGQLASFQPQIANPFASSFRLNRLDSTEARNIIIKPVLQIGLQIEASLVDALIEELRQPDSSEIDPAQLQLVCSALYSAFTDLKAKEVENLSGLTLSLYEQIGKTKAILGNHVRRTLNQIFEEVEERQLARRVLTELVSSDGRRIRLTRNEWQIRLRKAEVAPAVLDKVLETLVVQRLLLVNPDEKEGQTQYELTHDYLLNEIQVDPDVQLQKAAQELLAQEVEDFRRYGALLDPKRFAIIDSQRAYLQTTAEEEELLKHSADAIDQERQRAIKALRFRIRAMTIIALLLVPALYVGANNWMFYRRQNSDWQLTAFPSNPVFTIAPNLHRKTQNEPLICVGTADIGVGCTANMETWNLYQAGLPQGKPSILDNRQTWWGALLKNTLSTQIKAIAALTFDSADAHRLLAVVSDNGLYARKDDEPVWQKISTTAPVTEVQKLVAYADQIYILRGTTSLAPPDIRGTVNFSKDGGKEWNELRDATPAYGLIYDLYLASGPDITTSSIFLATDQGLFRRPLVGPGQNSNQKIDSSDKGGTTESTILVLPFGDMLYWVKYSETGKVDPPLQIKIYRGELDRETQVTTNEFLQTVSAERRPVKMAIGPANHSNCQQPPCHQIWLLLANSRVISLESDGTVNDLQTRPTWLPLASDLYLLPHFPVAERELLLMGHRDGLVHYCPGQSDLFTCVGDALPPKQL